VPPGGFSQAVPGTMVMFTMLVLLTSGAILLVSERERGLLRRLAATPISRGSIVLGKWVARMALALVQIGFAMALGGCWWPIEITPRWMQSFALFLPTGWAMDAMHKLISFGYDASAAVPHAAGLALAAVLTGVAGVRTFRYQ